MRVKTQRHIWRASFFLYVLTPKVDTDGLVCGNGDTIFVSANQIIETLNAPPSVSGVLPNQFKLGLVYF